MTKHLLMTMALACGLTAYANVLTPQQALQRAQTVTPQMAPANGTQAPTSYDRLVLTGNTASNEAAYYVYTDAQATGYMILSADDAAVPVLGYNTQGTFNPANENLAFWLGEYARQIEYGRQQGARVAANAAQSRPYRDPISPLCATQWGQDAPYNELCPTDDGVKCPSGCVATAMAQVMKYHNWPVKGTGTHSYSWNGQELSFDYGNTTFNWANMLPAYPTTKPIVQRKAVYTLMYACGVGVNMNYSANFSGATGPAVPAAMKAYFNYDQALDLYNRDYYPLLQWEQMIYDDLKNVGPVYYNGTGDGGGHAFVCDGYSRDGYFHFNWGWDGMSDGYYLLWALDPTAQGTGGSSIAGQGFNTGQQIVLGARKPQEGSQPASGRLGIKTAMQVEVKDVSGARSYSISTQPINTAQASATFKLGIRIEGNGVNTVVPSSSADITLNAGASINVRTAYNFPLPTLADGTYTITPLYQIDGGEWKDVLVKVGLPRQGFLTVANGEYTANIPTQGRLELQDVQLTSTLYPGNAFSVSATAVNNSGEEQYQALRAVIAYKNGNKYQVIGQSNLYAIDVPNGESMPFSFVTTLQSGTLSYDRDYYLYFVTTTDAYTRLNEPVKVHVPAQAEGLTVKVDPFNIATDDNGLINPAKCDLSGTFNCTQGYFAKSVYLVFYSNSTATGVSNYYDTGYFFADAGQSLPYSCNLTLKEMNTSKTYYLALGYISNQNFVRISDLKTVKFGAWSGIDDVATEAPAVEVERYNAYGQRLEAPVKGLNIVRYSDGTVAKEVVR